MRLVVQAVGCCPHVAAVSTMLPGDGWTTHMQLGWQMATPGAGATRNAASTLLCLLARRC